MIIVNIVRRHLAIQFFFLYIIYYYIICIELTGCTHFIIFIILRFLFVTLNQFRNNKNYIKLVYTIISRYYTDIYILGKLKDLKNNMQYQKMR